jgi:5'-3' exonuclease
MGVHGLWELLLPVGRRVDTGNVSRKRVAVDLSIWLTQFVRAMRDAEGAMVRNAHLLGVFRRCCKLLYLGVKPVFVFDGATPAIKRRTLRLRQSQRDNQTAKLRRLAEKLIMNRFRSDIMTKRMIAKKKQTQKSSSGAKSVKGAADAAALALSTHVAQADTAITTRKPPLPPSGRPAMINGVARVVIGTVGITSAPPSRSALLEDDDDDIVDDADIKYIDLRSERAGITSRSETTKSNGASLSDEQIAVQLVDDDEDALERDIDFSSISLPDDIQDLDDDALIMLPPSLQAEVFRQIKLQQRIRHREAVLSMQSDPTAFSKAQIKGFIANSRLSRRIAQVRTAINDQTGTSRRIASDNAREYVLEEHGDEEVDHKAHGKNRNEVAGVDAREGRSRDTADGSTGYIDDDRDGSDDDVGDDCESGSDTNDDGDVLRRVRRRREKNKTSRFPLKPSSSCSGGLGVRGPTPHKHAGVAWAGRVLENGAAFDLGRKGPSSLGRHMLGNDGASPSTVEQRLSAGQRLRRLQTGIYGSVEDGDDPDEAGEGGADGLIFKLDDGNETGENEWEDEVVGVSAANAVASIFAASDDDLEWDEGVSVAPDENIMAPVAAMQMRQQQPSPVLISKQAVPSIDANVYACQRPPVQRPSLASVQTAALKGLADSFGALVHTMPDSLVGIQDAGEGTGGNDCPGADTDKNAESQEAALNVFAGIAAIPAYAQTFSITPQNMKECGTAKALATKAAPDPQHPIKVSVDCGKYQQSLRYDRGSHQAIANPHEPSLPKDPFFRSTSDPSAIPNVKPPWGPTSTENCDSQKCPSVTELETGLFYHNAPGRNLATRDQQRHDSLQDNISTASCPARATRLEDETVSEYEPSPIVRLNPWPIVRPNSPASLADGRDAGKDSSQLGRDLEERELQLAVRASIASGVNERRRSSVIDFVQPTGNGCPINNADAGGIDACGHDKEDDNDDDYDDIVSVVEPIDISSHRVRSALGDDETVAPGSLAASSSSPAITSQVVPDVEAFDMPRSFAEAASALEANGAADGEVNQLNDADIARLQAEIGAENVILKRQSRALQGAAESISDEMYGETRDLLRLFGLPYLEAPMEAEAQCAFLNEKGLVDAILTEDSDAFLFGAKVVYRHLFREGADKFAESYDISSIMSELGVDREGLVKLAMLLGSDYTSGVRGIGIVNAMEILQAFPGMNGMREFKEWTETVTLMDKKPADEMLEGLSAEAVRRRFCWKHRNMKRNWELHDSFPNPNVVDAYMKPQVDTSETSFTWRSIDVDGLAQFCWEKFGWGSEKFEEATGPVLKQVGLFRDSGPQQARIDDYFKPHRFAKIRSVRLQSAVLGVAGENAGPLMAFPRDKAANRVRGTKRKRNPIHRRCRDSALDDDMIVDGSGAVEMVAKSNDFEQMEEVRTVCEEISNKEQPSAEDANVLRTSSLSAGNEMPNATKIPPETKCGTSASQKEMSTLRPRRHVAHAQTYKIDDDDDEHDDSDDIGENSLGKDTNEDLLLSCDANDEACLSDRGDIKGSYM